MSPFQVPRPAPALVGSTTVTGRLVPVVAVDAALISAVALVAECTVTLEKVTPIGPTTVMPATNPVPPRHAGRGTGAAAGHAAVG